MYVDLRDSVFEPSEPFLHGANLLQLLRKEGALPLYLTGHSLGGAYAHCAAHLAQPPPPAEAKRSTCNFTTAAPTLTRRAVPTATRGYLPK